MEFFWGNFVYIVYKVVCVFFIDYKLNVFFFFVEVLDLVYCII